MTDTEYRDEAVVQTLELDRRDVDDEGSAPKPPMRLRLQLGSLELLGGAPFIIIILLTLAYLSSRHTSGFPHFTSTSSIQLLQI